MMIAFILGLVIALIGVSVGHPILGFIVSMIVVAILIYNDPGKGLG